MRWRAISSFLSNARRQSACQPKPFSCIYGGARQSQPSPLSSSLSGFSSQGISNTTASTKPSNHSSFVNHSEGILCLLNRKCFLDELLKNQKTKEHAFCVIRSFASRSSSSSNRSRKPANEEMPKDITTSEDPFDSLTYNIPEKPVTFTEGASYSVVILLGLGLAAAAAYTVLKELVFDRKEYKIFNKALERVQNDNQVRVRIGSPVTGYGHETRNRAMRQQIQNKKWTDEDGVERVEVSFYIRGPRGAGKVFSEMFKDKADKQWKYTFLIVDITSPSPTQLILESYIPA